MLKDKVRELWYHGKHKGFEADQTPPRVPVRQVLIAIICPIVNSEAQEARIYIYCEGGCKDAADQRADALGRCTSKTVDRFGRVEKRNTAECIPGAILITN